MATMTCPTCGAPFQPGDLICLECGANLARARAARKHGPTREDAPRSRPGGARQPEPHSHREPNPQPGSQPSHSAPPHPAQPQPESSQPAPPRPSHLPPGSPVPAAPPYPWHDAPSGARAYPPAAPPAPPGQPPQVPAPRPAVSSLPPPVPARREETLVPPEERQSNRSRRGGHAHESTALMCPHCEAVITDQHATVCQQCLRPLRPQPVLRLAFPDGEVKIPVGQHLVLGRDAGQSPVAATFVQYDNVSRRHATVSLDATGQPRVRDEGSTNGTYVNDERIPPGVDVPLREGDSLRLAADVTGTVYLT